MADTLIIEAYGKPPAGARDASDEMLPEADRFTQADRRDDDEDWMAETRKLFVIGRVPDEGDEDEDD